ncbi:hypothetical protein VNI00_010457 [Paramarasmius palmivorus]|uniref:Uncharacterized protein n=1 Tax=Paramarasmius palmivorus TaxID=297713 RepID=A0AAW0CIT9_9AGAR
MAPLVWLITGTSVGLGRELTLAALRRGDKVIATARTVSQISDLEAKGAAVLELDVGAPLDVLQSIAQNAIGIYGQVDVVVHNAGAKLVGAIEENTPEESFEQFNTNVLGALNITRAFLPHLRERKTGTIVFMGSIVGWQSCPAVGLFAGTKWALRGISASLHDEIAPLGLRSICIDFGSFLTACNSPDARKPYIAKVPDYKKITDEYEASLKSLISNAPGDPAKGVEVILDIVRGEGVAQGKSFSKHVVLGSDCYEVAKNESEKALVQLEEWKDVSFSTNFV